MKTRHLKGVFMGVYSDTFLSENAEKKINGEIVKNWTTTSKIPDEGLVEPFWDGNDWVENKTQDEIDTIKKNEITKLLDQQVFNSRLWAKAIVMGKTKDDDLDYFEDVYRLKYEQAKDGTADTFLALEAQAEGMTLEDFKALVISKFEGGLAFFGQAKSMLEVFRKVVLKDLDDKKFDLAILRIKELDDLPESITPQGFGVEFQRILNLS